MEQYVPEGCKKLNELYTEQTFGALIDADHIYVQTLGMSANANLMSFAKSYLWYWYKTSYIAFAGTDEEIKSFFEERLKMSFMDHWRFLNADWAVYENALNDYEQILKGGGMASHKANSGTDSRTISRTDTGTGDSYTKQADTPTTANPSTEFVDEFTDYQSKTTNSDSKNSDATDSLAHGMKSDTDLSRTQSSEKALAILKSAKRHTADDITDLFSDSFVGLYTL